VAGRLNYNDGDVLRRWTLVEFIAEGGNGDVWRAEADGEPAAVKILHRTHPKDYERFRREVEICQRRDPSEIAILPVLDSHLPETSTKRDRAWFAMPLAETLMKALAGASLTDKVAAVRDIARTLARLLEEERVNHRDVKPENLYMFEGRAVVGDFGLAKRPDDPSLTDEGKIPGPFHHLPSEVFFEDDPDWERVDVYCLANSLWRLVLERRYPPRGQIRADEEYSLSLLLPDETYIAGLASLIAAATAAAARRPTLSAFAEQLDSWLTSRETKDEFVETYMRDEVRNLAVLRWVISFVRREPVFGMWMYEVGDPESPAEVEGLSRAQVRDALIDLIESGFVSGEEGLVLGSREPVFFERVYPTVYGLEEVEDIDVVTLQAAPLLRAFLTSADIVGFPYSVEPVEVHGGLTRTPPEAYFEMWLLEQLGFLELEPLAETGGGVSFMDVHATRAGKEWLYRAAGGG
jgi:tRNA A-37 threonylcarbamoyl transferase component Bud32